MSLLKKSRFLDLLPLQRIFIGSLLFFIFTFEILHSAYTSRLKDVAYLSNAKYNVFVGYGLVVGLPGTGDRRNVFTEKSLNVFLKNQGVETEQMRLTARNVAMVSVTARSFGFLDKGDLVDVSVASIGDARSINSGLLLPTTLRAGNGQNYMLASGVINADEENPTTGIVNLGGAVERSFSEDDNSNQSLDNLPRLSFRLNHFSPGYGAAIKQSIEQNFDAVLVTLDNEKNFSIAKRNEERFTSEEIVELLNSEVNINPIAKIIFDQKTGVVIVGADVKINQSHISLPSATLSLGNPTDNERLGKDYANVSDLMAALNSINASIDEIVSIFTALKKSGALNAEIIFQ